MRVVSRRELTEVLMMINSQERTQIHPKFNSELTQMISLPPAILAGSLASGQLATRSVFSGRLVAVVGFWNLEHFFFGEFRVGQVSGFVNAWNLENIEKKKGRKDFVIECFSTYSIGLEPAMYPPSTETI